MSKIKKEIRTIKSILRLLISPTPVQINLIPTYRCNLDCSYCHQHSIRGKSLSYDDFKSLVAQAEKLGAGYFNFTGGEPLLWEPLSDAVALLTQKNFGSHLTSNAFLLEDKIAEELGRAELDLLNISLDGVDDLPNSDKTLSKHDPGFTERLHYMKERYKVRIQINGVISQYNIDQIPDILSYAGENNFIASLGLEVPRLGSMRVKNKEIPDGILSKIKPGERLLIEPRSYFTNPSFNCFAAKRRSLSIGPNMWIQYCFKIGRKYKPFTEFKQDDYEDYLQHLKEQLKQCNPLCSSNCAYMADYFAHNPFKAVELFLRT